MLTHNADTDIIGGMSKRAATADLSDQLRSVFKKSGMSRFELARRAGISYSIVHRFVAADRDVALRTASRLADVLGLELRAKRK